MMTRDAGGVEGAGSLFLPPALAIEPKMWQGLPFPPCGNTPQMRLPKNLLCPWANSWFLFLKLREGFLRGIPATFGLSSITPLIKQEINGRFLPGLVSTRSDVFLPLRKSTGKRCWVWGQGRQQATPFPLFPWEGTRIFHGLVANKGCSSFLSL